VNVVSRALGAQSALPGANRRSGSSGARLDDDFTRVRRVPGRFTPTTTSITSRSEVH
jgi:hypothetical protein